MQIREAHEKLKKMAEGKYCCTEYHFRTHPKCETKSVCYLYIDGYGSVEQETFKESFQSMKNLINGIVEEEQTIEA